MSKRHIESTPDENPRKKRKVSADEVLVEAARKGVTTAVRAGLEKFAPGIDSKTVAFDAAHEACRGNHDECLALLLPYVETTQMGFGILLSECVHADHTACTEVLLQHWKSVCSNGARVPIKSEDSKGRLSGLCPALWSDPAVCQVIIDAGADIETKSNNGYSPLLIASHSGSLDVVKLLVRAGAGVRVADPEGATCLGLASDAGHTETVRYLVGLKEMDVDHTDVYGQTALHYAVELGHVDVVQVLIDAGADVEARDKKGSSPINFSGTFIIVKKLVEAGAGVRTVDTQRHTCLHLAADCGHTETVRYLVGLPDVEVDHTEGEGCTALHWAADKNHADMVQVLIDAGADIEARDTSRNSPLLWACGSGSLDAVKLLVRAGAGVSVTNNEGHTFLTAAADCGHTETVRYLVGLPEVEVDHTDGEGCTALHWAADMNHADMVQVLIDAGADIEARDASRNWPLLWACGSGSLDAVKLLVRAGAGVSVTDSEGRTCLAAAASRGHTETVRYLVGLSEVEVNHTDGEGRTALHWAADTKHADVVQVLIDAGADIEARDTSRNWPLPLACGSGSLDAVKLLVRAGAGVSVTDNEGCTCLTAAAHHGHTETVRYLVGLSKVDVNHTDTNGYTALHHAVQQRHVGVVQVLVEHGVDTSLHTRNGNTALQLAEISGCRDCCRHLS